MAKDGLLGAETYANNLRRLIGRLGGVLGFLVVVLSRHFPPGVNEDERCKRSNLRQSNFRESREQEMENSSV